MQSLRAAVFALLVPVQASACGIALAFAVDASGSVTAEDFAVQLHGVANGLRDPEIAQAIIGGNAALSVLQWSGQNDQFTSIGWTQISSAAALEAFATELERIPRVWRGSNTAIGSLLAYSQHMFAQAPACNRFVLDVSGNGPSNEGSAPTTLRVGLWENTGITVNAIVIDPTMSTVRQYFEQNVIIGPGSFVIDVPSRDAFAEGMREKLKRELAQQFVLLEPRSHLGHGALFQPRPVARVTSQTGRLDALK